MKLVRAEIFEPVFRDDAQPFQTFLQRASQLREVERLYDSGHGIMLLMKNIRRPDDNLWVGQVHRIKTNGFPDRIDLRTLQEHELGLLANQALVERVHFAYRSDLSALALQSSRDFRSSSFASYVAYVSELPFELSVVLKRGGYQKLLRWRTIANMNVRLANPPDAGEFVGLAAPGVAEIAGLLREFGAANIEIRICRERRRRASLLFDPVRDFVNGILGRDGVVDSFDKLSVEGKREDDEKLESVDLIRDRLTYSDNVDFDEQHRLDSGQCENLVTRALAEHQATLGGRQN